MKNHKTNQNQKAGKRSNEFAKVSLQFQEKTMDNFPISCK